MPRKKRLISPLLKQGALRRYSVKKDWWKDFFNEIYLITDARSVCNDTLTRQEAHLLEKVLGLDKKDRILDLCGGHGRHSLELARRGYRDITVLDFSDYLIDPSGSFSVYSSPRGHPEARRAEGSQ